MLSGKEEISQPPSSSIVHRPNTELGGRREVYPCDPVQNGLHDTVKSARTGPSSEGGHERIRENKIFENGESEQGVLSQQSPCLPEQQPNLHTSESLPHSSDVEENHHSISKGNLEIYSNDTPRDAASDMIHGRPETSLNPLPVQSPPSSQPVTPSALPLHLIPLLPQSSPSPKRQRRSLGLSSANQTNNIAGGFSERGGLPSATGGSPQSLRTHLQNFSAESAGISRTLAYAMDQMDATPLLDAELDEPVMMKAEVDRYSEGDGATKQKTVRFQRQPAELAERLWTEATAKADEKGEIPLAERDLQYCLYRLGLFTLEEAVESPSRDATSEMDDNVVSCTTEGGSRTVGLEVEDTDSGSEAERATLASQTQTLQSARLQEYTRLKQREVELRHEEAEARILEERLEAREKELKIGLATVRQRLEAVRQRKASLNCREEIIRQKLEAITKEQDSDNVLGADATPESS